MLFSGNSWDSLAFVVVCLKRGVVSGSLSIGSYRRIVFACLNSGRAVRRSKICLLNWATFLGSRFFLWVRMVFRICAFELVIGFIKAYLGGFWL